MPTNLDIDPDKYISHNPHFCKSALSRFSQWDFIAMVERHPLGSQLFFPFSGRPFLVVVAPDEDGTPGEPHAFLCPPGIGVFLYPAKARPRGLVRRGKEEGRPVGRPSGVRMLLPS